MLFRSSHNLLRQFDQVNSLTLREQLSDAVQRIAQQAERAGQVIKSVHDFVRRRAPSREPVSPRDLVDSVLPLVRLQARKLMIDLSLHLPDDLPKIWCDRAMVEQVILNLARNGMQAMSEASARTRRALSISLSLTHGPQETEQLCVEVADLGSGIDAEVEINLYTPFFTTKEEGMGLGLSLCRTVV